MPALLQSHIVQLLLANLAVFEESIEVVLEEVAEAIEDRRGLGHASARINKGSCIFNVDFFCVAGCVILQDVVL